VCGSTNVRPWVQTTVLPDPEKVKKKKKHFKKFLN
jgi:hypothetical protein